jgi:hypothetical protein
VYAGCGDRTRFEWKQPPRSAQWHDRYIALKGRPAVGLAIAQLGEIGHYRWTYGFNQSKAVTP